MKSLRSTLVACATVSFAAELLAQAPADLSSRIDAATEAIQDRLVSWRRDLHQYPELSNREFRTAGIVAAHLEELGLTVRKEVAHTGVLGLLQGGKPGPVVALRADMDGLPVVEMVDLPFASKERGVYKGQEVGVMHACGHDNHVAILMGAAEVLSSMREDLPGSVLFVFQPAEEGAPPGEEGGAEMMLKEGAFEDPAPEVVFGLHVFPGAVGSLSYRPGGAMASSDTYSIMVRGKQTHGAEPWGGVDPIVVASQIVLGIQTIASRQLNVTKTPSIITVGTIHGGVRHNIIPDQVELTGTIRTFDPEVRREIHARLKRTAENIASAAGAVAEVNAEYGIPVMVNDPELTAKMLPTLERVAGSRGLSLADQRTTAEDFAYFSQAVPGLYFNLGVTPEGEDPLTVARNHSPFFFADEKALPVGVRAMANLAVDYMQSK
ncbi:MAG: amidohydrolase [Planctomycetota bacterium]